VHRELADYAILSQSAVQATKIIIEGLPQPKQVADAPGIAAEN
jgi:hypothetical protein